MQKTSLTLVFLLVVSLMGSLGYEESQSETTSKHQFHVGHNDLPVFPWHTKGQHVSELEKFIGPPDPRNLVEVRGGYIGFMWGWDYDEVPWAERIEPQLPGIVPTVACSVFAELDENKIILSFRFIGAC